MFASKLHENQRARNILLYRHKQWQQFPSVALNLNILHSTEPASICNHMHDHVTFLQPTTLHKTNDHRSGYELTLY